MGRRENGGKKYGENSGIKKRILLHKMWQNNFSNENTKWSISVPPLPQKIQF